MRDAVIIYFLATLIIVTTNFWLPWIADLLTRF